MQKSHRLEPKSSTKLDETLRLPRAGDAAARGGLMGLVITREVIPEPGCFLFDMVIKSHIMRVVEARKHL